MIQWKRSDKLLTGNQRTKFFADTNSPNVSHILCHEVLRMKGKGRKEYFEAVHNLWESYIYKDLPFVYYDREFKKVPKDSFYQFVTIEISKLRSSF
jgi:hypothetical protein